MPGPVAVLAAEVVADDDPAGGFAGLGAGSEVGLTVAGSEALAVVTASIGADDAPLDAVTPGTS